MAKEIELKLKEGDQAPMFTASTSGGAQISLSDYKGKNVILYFYPKDDTPGCTKEACAFRDVWDKYKHAGIRVIGVSIDREDSHRKFAESYKLPFPLIADPQHVWSDAFGVGRFLGSADERVSFLIDK